MDKELTGKDLFDFMDSGRKVKVTCKDGMEFSGYCLAYSDVFLEESDGVRDYGLDIDGTLIFLHEMQSVEYID